jgi:hypothetical protein
MRQFHSLTIVSTTYAQFNRFDSMWCVKLSASKTDERLLGSWCFDHHFQNSISANSEEVVENSSTSLVHFRTYFLYNIKYHL